MKYTSAVSVNKAREIFLRCYQAEADLPDSLGRVYARLVNRVESLKQIFGLQAFAEMLSNLAVRFLFQFGHSVDIRDALTYYTMVFKIAAERHFHAQWTISNLLWLLGGHYDLGNFN